jgi:ribosomal protein S27E
MVQFQSIEQRKARKKHECHLCGKPILPGCEYIHENFKNEGGKITSLKRHIHCDAMLDAYNEKFNTEEFYDEPEVLETIWQEVCKKICGEEQWEECFDDPSCMMSCELCQRELVHPSALGAAIQSVRENTL